MNPFEFFEDTQAKQHINLSTFAWDIIEQDIVEFQNTSPGKISGFINRILEIYLRDGLFPADITTTIHNYEHSQREWLKNIPDLTDDQTNSILNTLKENYIHSLLQEFHTEKGIGKKFDVNNACRLLLKEKGEAGYEVKVFQKRGVYINTILENYARLPMANRESIFFAERIRELEYCIQKKQVIYVNAAFRSDAMVPYKIISDKYNMHIYLVAIPYEAEGNNGILFRISQINSISRTSIFIDDISKDQILSVENEIKQKGVQYLPGNVEKIRVRLTATGKNLYHRITFQRPTYEPQTKEEAAENIFTFSCTPYQAYVYFKGLGCEAEVLSPAKLREDIMNFYKSGYETYEK